MHSLLTTAAIAISGLLLLATALCSAEAQPRSEAIHDAVQKEIDAKEVSGAVTLVATKDKLLHEDAAGFADTASGRKMSPDTLFWIASMTKPVTGAAVMMMQDAGKLSIDDPVEKHLPEFKGLRFKDGPSTAITIRHLLTHTSGMGEISANETKSCHTLEDAVKLYVRKPLQFEPGTKWSYCQSSINTAARIVEVVSGELYPDFLEKHLFKPLGMNDTTFYLTSEQDKRLATSYLRNEKGELQPTENFLLAGASATSRERFPHANGGLFSTARDYVKFCQMVSSGGRFEGHQVLSPESVKQMTTILTGDLKTGFTPGNGWGLAWCVVREPQGVTKMLSAGTHGHGGVYGTQAWIDPVKDRIYILLVQRANFPNADDSGVRKAFQQAAAELK